VTVTLVDAVPPAPVHVNAYVLVAFSVPVEALPDTDLLPAHIPDAVHDVAFVEDQVSVEVLPLITDAGLAESVTVGTGGITVTVTVFDTVPPAPVHASP
jgi:hypothetical protein